MAKAKPIKQRKKMSKSGRIAVIVAIIMLLALAASLLAGGGFFFRVQKGASSDNFKVNASMMEYYTMSYYQNWYNQNYYYILLGYTKFDPSLPLNEQYTDTAKTQTYYDFFVSGAKNAVTTYLKYCEAAMADGTVDYDKLESEAKQYAKETIAALKEAAKAESDKQYETNGTTLTFADYIRNNFGEHVNKNDLKKALIIEHIAASYYEIVHERIHGGVTTEREDKYFEDNLASFVSAEYLVYSLSGSKVVEFPNADDYKGGAESAAYKKAIEGLNEEAIKKITISDYEGGVDSLAYKRDLKTAEDNQKANKEGLERDKAIIEKLAAATTAEEFKRILIEEKYQTSFDSAKNTAINKFESSYKPSADVMKKFNTDALKKAILDAVMNGDDDVDAAVIITDEFITALIDEKYGAHFDVAYNAAIKGFTDADKPAKEALDAFKASLKQAIIDAVANGKEDIDASLVVVGEGSSEKWTATAKTLPKEIIKSLKDMKTKWADVTKALPKSTIVNLEKVITDATKTSSYTVASVLGRKLFGGVKAQFGIEYEESENYEHTSVAAGEHWMVDVLAMNVENYKIQKEVTNAAIAELVDEIAKEADADKKKALEDSKKALEDSLKKIEDNLKAAEEKIANVETTSQYSFSAYFVTEAAHRHDYKLRNVGHILFKVDEKGTDGAYKTKEDAKDAAEELLAKINAETDLTKEKFEEFGKVTHDSNVFYDGVKKGQMVEEFEDWLFEATTVGQVGLVETQYGYHIMYYVGESNDIAWRVDAKEGAANEDQGEWYDSLPDYGITFNDKIFEKIFHIEDSHEGHNH